MPKNITIVGGSGAVGIAQAIMFARAENNVTILNSYNGKRSKSFEDLKEIDELKLIQSINGEANILQIAKHKINFANSTLDIKNQQDLIIVLTKNSALNPDLAKIILDIPQKINNQTPVVVFANGVMPWIFPEKNFGEIKISAISKIYDFAQIISPERLIGGVLNKYGANKISAGTIAITKSITDVENTLCMATSSKNNKTLKGVVEIFQESNLNCKIESTKEAIIKKLGLNIIGCISCLFGKTDLENPNLQIFIKNTNNEYFELAKKMGISLAKNAEEYNKNVFSQQFVKATFNPKTSTTPSILQDLQSGRVTEKDELLKAVLDIGELHNVNLTNIKQIYKAIEKIENEIIARKDNSFSLRAIQEKLTKKFLSKIEIS